MDKQRALFYGFLIGFALIVIPIPHSFLMLDIDQPVSEFIRSIGYLIFLMSIAPLLKEWTKVFFNKN